MSFRRLPPWIFSSRARTDQLVCDPRSYIRAYQDDGRPLWAPCLSWAPGPATLASTGDGTYSTLFGSNWLLQICEDGSWVLYQRQGTETLVVIAWDVVPPVAGITARHPTLAFDQAARPAMAWEEDDGIRLREYDEFASDYHFVGPFTGVDPVLWNDATANAHIPGSDVILFYLSTDRLTLSYRLQSENFLVAHDHHTFDAPAILDAHELLMLRYQLKIGLESGGGKDLDGDDPQALRSALYPVYLSDVLQVTIGNFAEAENALVVISRAFETEGVDAVVGNFAATYTAVILVQTFDAEALDLAVGNFAAAYPNVVILDTFDAEGVDATTGNFAAAANALVVIQPTLDSESLAMTVGNFASAAYVAI